MLERRAQQTKSYSLKRRQPETKALMIPPNELQQTMLSAIYDIIIILISIGASRRRKKKPTVLFALN